MVIEENTPNLTYNGRFSKKRNTRVINHRTEYMSHITQIHMPVRYSHRRREINTSQILSWKYQYNDLPIQTTHSTKEPPKGLGKTTSSSPFQLKNIRITSSSWSPKNGPPATIIHHHRVNLITIPGQGPTTPPQRMVILLPTNTPPRKIQPPKIHTYRGWTHTSPPRRYPPPKS